MLVVFLNEDKLLKSTAGVDGLFQILMTLSVEKQAWTLEEL